MKYIKDMTMCTIDSNEALNNLDTPAEIIIKCGYKTNEGFCVYSDSCDFNDVLKQSDADMLNK